MSNVREAKAKAETAERERSWAKAKDTEKSYITRLAEKDREKDKFEARARKKFNAARRVVVEAATNIRASA